MPESVDTKFPEIKIKAVTIDSPITVCRSQVLVIPPHWEPGIDLRDGDGSRRPGVLVIKNHSEKIAPEPGMGENTGKLVVELEVTGPPGLLDLNDAELIGELGGIIFTGPIRVDGGSPPGHHDQKNKVKQKVETIKVEVVPREEPVSFKRIRGDMTWQVKCHENKIDIDKGLEETRLEIFWIYGYPGKMFKRGVWVEVLRLLDVECFGLKNQGWIIQRIINYCHSGTGLRYDSYLSASYYGLIGSGGAFNLNAYLVKTYPFCNCFDQAGALQTLLGAMGIEVIWVFMDPYGYLRETNLVGRGRCNNPIFLGRQLPELYPVNLPDRSGFGSHAFCIWEKEKFEIVLDACAGPHFGDNVKKSFISGFKQSYIEESIDGLTSLYNPENFLKRPGRLDDMDKDNEGVTDVHADTYSPFDVRLRLSPREKDKIEEFAARIGYDQAGKGLLPDEGLVFPWPTLDLRAVESKTGSWIKTLEDLRIGFDVSVRQWSFIGENESVNIEIYVGNNVETAKNRLTLLALSTTLPHVPHKKKPQAEQMGHLHMYWHTPYYRTECWWYYNVCINVYAFNSAIDLTSLNRSIWEQIHDKKNIQDVKKNLEEYLPAINSVLVIPAKKTPAGEPVPYKINVGEFVTIQVESGPNPLLDADHLRLEFFPDRQALRLVNESFAIKGTGPDKVKTFKLTFEGRTPGIIAVKFVLADWNTQLCSHPWETAINIIKEKELSPQK
jgi:hypothetical protein